ncbi:MAG: porin family protein [Gemmatimonadota bacterium]
MRTLRFVLAVLLLGILLPISAQAQNTEFGFKGGVNIATHGGDDADDMDSRIGIIVGGSFAFNLTPMFAIQPEFLYAMKGVKAENEFLGTLTVEQDYLELPVLARLKIPTAPGSSFRPSLLAGPALGIEISCDIEGRDEGVTASVSCSDFGIDTKTVDFGLIFGGELGIDRGGMRIGLEARYNLGLTSIRDGEDVGDFKNRALSIMVTIAFGG